MLVWFSFTSWPSHTDTPGLPALGHDLSTSAFDEVAAAAGVGAALTETTAAFPFPLPLRGQAWIDQRHAKAGPKAQDSEDVKGVNKWQSRTNQACAPCCWCLKKVYPNTIL